jgi:hypothetical protein
MSFDAAAVNALVSSVESIAMITGQFRRVNVHEPKSLPGSGLTCAIWVQELSPIARGSGLSSTSGYVVLNARIYGNAFKKPEDELDPLLMTAATALVGAFSGDFTLGGTVRNIDLLGEYGQQLRALAGYLTIEQVVYRIMTVTVPCIVNDMWNQVP